MNELIIGIVGSLIASAIWAILYPGRGGESGRLSRWRWFWRLLTLVGKFASIYGLIVIVLNLVVQPVNAEHVAVGAMCLILGSVAWLVGYLLK